MVTNERVDDIPLLLARQGEMEIARLIDEHFVPHGNWQGASPGEIMVVWLTFILSEGDHRLNQVEEWFGKRCETIRHYIGAGLTAQDLSDDRLAILLRELSDDDRWSAFESALNRHTIRVYDLSTEPGTPWVRLDATTASGHWQVSEEGLFQYGYSKDHRPDLPQLKVMMSTLDPLGMPLVTTVVGGNQADDPLYVPAIQAVRQSLQQDGLLYIGDVKMAAIDTRTTVQAQDDYYLCPLSEVQVPRHKMLEWIAPALTDPSLLIQIERAQADGERVQIADAFERQVEQTGVSDGVTVTWPERHIFTRSAQYAQSQTQSLDGRLQRAQAEIAALPKRKQGKPRLQTRCEFVKAVDKILARHNVVDLLDITYETIIHEQHVRKYDDRPARIERHQEFAVSATYNQAAIDSLVPTLGWRIYATNAPHALLPTDQAVVAYREQYTVERAFGRLKGKPLSLTPMYLEKDDHATGLVRLLSIGLRTLSLFESSVRRSLQQTQTEISGLYAGNPKRTTKTPTAERLLTAFKDIILTVIQEADAVSYHLTPLSDTHSRILALLGFDDSLYLSLAQHTSWIPPNSWKPPVHLHEP